ncbi:MAG TPA: hypothetical protein VMN79_01995, partial [Casimicrobiaceae bacterium]|nr:hypothetical protein [Casimicrobiaceae bacterium]
VAGREGLIGRAHRGVGGASFVPPLLARAIDNLYILGKPAHKVKISLSFSLFQRLVSKRPRTP